MNQAKEKRLQFTEKAQQIVDRMTLEEKVYLMSGNLSLQDMMADAMGEASHYNAKPYPAGGNEKEGGCTHAFLRRAQRGCVRDRRKHLFSGNDVPRRQL